MIDPKISVVIPAYNVSMYISRMMDVLLNQTFNAFEIIVVDDLSTDNTVQILEQYNDDRITLVKRLENSGTPYAPREDGVKVARGEWIVYLDADDYIEKTYLEELFNRVCQYNVDLCSPQMIRVNELNIPSGWVIPEETFEFDRKWTNIEAFNMTVPEWKIGMNGAIVRKTVYLRALEKFHKEGKRTTRSDEILSRVLLLESTNGYISSKTKYYYTENDNSITSKFNLKSFEWIDTISDFFQYVESIFGKNSVEYERVQVYDYISYYSTLMQFTQQVSDVSVYKKGMAFLKRWHSRLEWKVINKYRKGIKNRIRVLVCRNINFSVMFCFWRNARYDVYKKIRK